jgi:hypothetical protein
MIDLFIKPWMNRSFLIPQIPRVSKMAGNSLVKMTIDGWENHMENPWKYPAW